jgi:hypothetical protein
MSLEQFVSITHDHEFDDINFEEKKMNTSNGYQNHIERALSRIATSLETIKTPDLNPIFSTVNGLRIAMLVAVSITWSALILGGAITFSHMRESEVLKTDVKVLTLKVANLEKAAEVARVAKQQAAATSEQQ